MIKLTAVILFLSFFVLRCGGDSASVRADLTGATAVAIETEATGSGKLRKIGADGTVSAVFDQERDVFGVQVGETHVVVRGDFGGCSLIAIAKQGSPGNPKCLSQKFIGTYDPAKARTDTDFDDVGFAVKGTQVLFAIPETSGKSELHLWDLKNDSDETLISLDAVEGSKMTQAFFGKTNANVCAIAPSVPKYGSTRNSLGKVLCGDSSNKSFSALSAVTVATHDVFQMNNMLIMYSSKINLEDLAVSGAVGTSSDWHLTIFRIATAQDESVFHVGTDNGLHMTDTTGLSDHVQLGSTDNGGWEQIAATKDYLWLIGENRLKRIDLATKVFDTTNYLGTSSLLQITNFSVTSKNRLRVDGSTASGKTTLYYDAVTGAGIPNAEEQAPLRSMINL